MKYSRDVLREAVTASHSMADVLRHLGLPLNGGAHAHLRRRISAFGLDTSHFLGRAARRRAPVIRRLAPDEVLVVRSADRGRAAPGLLRRALVETGRAYRCANCDIGGTWNGRPLTLHVDHVNGDFWDCRGENLRFLCPNCHSQTPTYAGRNRRVFAVTATDTSARPADGSTRAPLTEAEVAELLPMIDRGELTVSAAARLIGCHRNHVGRLRRRLAESGTATVPPRRPYRTEACRDAVIGYALTHPDDGPKTIARALRQMSPAPVRVAHGTVSRILAAAGLNTRQARRQAAIAVNMTAGANP